MNEISNPLGMKYPRPVDMLLNSINPSDFRNPSYFKKSLVLKGFFFKKMYIGIDRNGFACKIHTNKTRHEDTCNIWRIECFVYI